MVNAHEVSLDVEKFNNMVNVDYIILQIGEIEVNDFILFKQIDSASVETGLFQMTQVRGIVQDDGLKEGYALLLVTKL